MATLDERAISAQSDREELDSLLRAYTPFVATRVIASVGRPDDEAMQLGLLAFCEAVQAYRSDKGSFLSFARLVITRRMADYRRKEGRRDVLLDDIAPEKRDYLIDAASMRSHDAAREQDDRREEIRRLDAALKQHDISFALLAESSPRQERSRDTCRRAISEAVANPILAESIRQGRVPLKELAKRCGCTVKNLEKHRRYLVAAITIHSGDYPLLSQYVPLQR